MNEYKPEGSKRRDHYASNAKWRCGGENFYRNAEYINLSADIVRIKSTPEYLIGYIPSVSGFGIHIIKKPLNVSRRNAETEFLRALGITQQDACKLNVSLGVPQSDKFAPELTESEYGLSFCPNGIPFQRPRTARALRHTVSRAASSSESNWSKFWSAFRTVVRG